MTNKTSDEETPLLAESSISQKWKPTTRTQTPLPKLQIAVLLILNICEPLIITSIYAYITLFVSELEITGGDKRKVGYYVGILESLYFAIQSLTALHWSRTSDKVGRKPVLLFGLFGSITSILLFGLSRTFWRLALSQCLAGLLDGNIGVLRSVMGDLTDSSNRAQGFALLPIVWAVAATVGPIIGGHLSRPHDHFPGTFTSKFWVEHPYFLPCAVVAGILLLVFLISVVFLKETAPGRSRGRVDGNGVAALTTEKPVPFRDVLVYPVLISVANYGALCFLSITLSALLPLFFAMPPSLGGLGASPAMIGYVFSASSALNGIFQTLFFARIVRRFGERRVLITALLMYPMIFLWFPITSIVSRNDGPKWLIWMLLVILLVLKPIREIGFTCVYLYITAAAPNKRSLGTTNGVGQISASVARAIGPALSASLFSWSIEKNLLGGYAVYVFLFMCSCFAVLLAMRLPARPWEERD
ncbi:hypothetical protein AMATHDRAFT_59768 [Amanita thiersii Skay4041]|uniref:Major facilitator superfamily (MFS) profile domain-containing protein n=1 Tax=Amanita thiersii Skay4041 TaxID=703135 RepID=A0A2A9NKH5_9AGAR|nr:hypothetical protein AMATHDRAFT_59768 [Amanita thiersii Skay4041]